MGDGAEIPNEKRVEDDEERPSTTSKTHLASHFPLSGAICAMTRVWVRGRGLDCPGGESHKRLLAEQPESKFVRSGIARDDTSARHGRRRRPLCPGRSLSTSDR